MESILLHGANMKKYKCRLILIIIVILFIAYRINLKDSILIETKLESNNKNMIINKILESTLKMKDLKPENLSVLDEKLLSEEEQNSYSSNVTLGEPVLFNNFSDYERYFVYRNEEFIRNVYTYKSDNINITLEQALDLCAEVLEREDPNLVMQRTMKEEKEGYVGYTFNYREFGDKNWLQIIENKIGTLGVEPYDGIQYEVYMYEDIVDDIETGEGHTAITATFHIFLRDKLLVLE